MTAIKLRSFGGTKMSDDAARNKDRTMPQAANFQHRHFAAIADMLRRYPLDCAPQRKAHLVEYFADELAKTNPKFSRTRFIAACVES